jgi:hypothetical protein
MRDGISGEIWLGEFQISNFADALPPFLHFQAAANKRFLAPRPIGLCTELLSVKVTSTETMK